MKTLILTTLAVAAFGLTAGQALAYGGSGNSDSWSTSGNGRNCESRYEQSRRTTSCYPNPNTKSKRCDNDRGDRYETNSYPRPKSCHNDRSDRYDTSNYPMTKKCHNDRGDRYETGRRQVDNGYWQGTSGNDSCYRPSKKEKCHQKATWEDNRGQNMCHQPKYGSGQRQKRGSASSWDHSRDFRY